MGMQPMYFQPETFAQANPVIGGFEAGQQMYANSIKNQYAQPMAQQALQNAIMNNQILNVKSQYAQPEAEQALTAAQLNNQVLGNTAKFAPLMSQSALDTAAAQRGLMGAQSGFYGAQAQDIMQGKIPLEQAQAGLTTAQIPYVPQEAMGKYYMGLGRVMQYSPTSMLLRSQNNPLFQSAIANNPQLAANLGGAYTALLNNQNPSLTAMGINLNQPGGIGSQLPAPQGQPNTQTQAQAQIQSQNNNSVLPYSIQTLAQMNQNQQPQGSQMGIPQNSAISPPVSGVNTPFGPANPIDAANIQTQAQNLLMSKNYTPQQAQQMIYDNSAQNMIRQLTPDMQSISSFSGLSGMANLKQQQLLASINSPTSPDYQKYINFSRVQAPLLVNEIRRAFGGQATDSERETMDRLIQPNEWDKNPQIMLNQLQSLVGTLHANSMAITQTKAQNLNQASNPQPINIPGAQGGSPSQGTQMVTVKAPSGDIVQIPAKNLQAALKRGAIQQ